MELRRSLGLLDLTDDGEYAAPPRPAMQRFRGSSHSRSTISTRDPALAGALGDNLRFVSAQDRLRERGP